jgi:hypothetical protein
MAAARTERAPCLSIRVNYSELDAGLIIGRGGPVDFRMAGNSALKYSCLPEC